MKINLKYTRAMLFTGQELHISTVDKDNLQLFHIVGYVASCCFPCPLRIQSSVFRMYSMYSHFSICVNLLMILKWAEDGHEVRLRTFRLRVVVLILSPFKVKRFENRAIMTLTPNSYSFSHKFVYCLYNDLIWMLCNFRFNTKQNLR